MKSMTGFGQTSLVLPAYKFIVEVSSVNKKNLEIVVNTPKNWQFFEYLASSFIKKKVDRGRVRVTLSVESHENLHALGKALQSPKTEELIDQLKDFMKKRDEDFALSTEALLQIIQLTQEERNPSASTEFHEHLLEALEKATDSMLEMRAQEGEQISRDFKLRLLNFEKLVMAMESASEDLPEQLKQKLYERLHRANLEIDADDERVLKELTIYSEKCDVTEEITRLKSHILQFAKTTKSNAPIGRKLEFILQEMSRELNTFSAKSARNASNEIALEARMEVEKLREQVMNVE